MNTSLKITTSKKGQSVDATATSPAEITTTENIHLYLENEKQKNKLESWNRLDKMEKNNKLQAYADKYGREKGLSSQDVSVLKAYFLRCLDNAKLQRAKEVIYDRESREIRDIPSLFMNPLNHNFTLRNLDPKRAPNTLKSLGPRKRKEPAPASAPTPVAENQAENVSAPVPFPNNES